MRRSEATSRSNSVEIRDEPPRARAIGVVFGAERLLKQSLLGPDPRKHDNEHQHGDGDPDAGAKRQSPTKRGDEKAEIARMANDAVNPAGDELDDQAGLPQGR